MSADKYPNIFSCQMEATVYILDKQLLTADFLVPYSLTEQFFIHSRSHFPVHHRCFSFRKPNYDTNLVKSEMLTEARDKGLVMNL